MQELDFSLVSMVDLQSARLDGMIAGGREIPAVLLSEAQAMPANGQELSREMTSEIKLRGVSEDALNRVNIERTAIWFGILVLIVVEVGLITPPVGMNLFVIKAMDRKTTDGRHLLSGFVFCVLCFGACGLAGLLPDHRTDISAHIDET